MVAFALSVLTAPPGSSMQITELQAAEVQAGRLTTDLYAPPSIRPYEPPSDFGRAPPRQGAEGDADATVRARPLEAAVSVEAYHGAYEPLRTPREVSYQAGVEAARRAQNARMGGLDGLWRVVDADGRPLMDLVLTDRGPAWPVEGALSLIQAQGVALRDQMTPVSAVTDEGDARVISAEIEGRRLTLRLQRDGQAWRGQLSGLSRGAGQPIALLRPETW